MVDIECDIHKDWLLLLQLCVQAKASYKTEQMRDWLSENSIDIDKEYRVTINLSNEQVVNCKYQLIRVEKGDNGLYTISGRFTNLSNIDKMTLIQFCMKKDMENMNK